MVAAEVACSGADDLHAVGGHVGLDRFDLAQVPARVVGKAKGDGCFEEEVPISGGVGFGLCNRIPHLDDELSVGDENRDVKRFLLNGH